MSESHYVQTSKFTNRNFSFQVFNKNGYKEIQVREVTSGQRLQPKIYEMGKEDWGHITKKETNLLNLQGKLLHVTTSQVFSKTNLKK